jgi:hypothetical protein
MPFTLDQLAPLGTAGIIIILLLWWNIEERKEKNSWIGRFENLLKAAAELEVRRSDAREKNYEVMAGLASAIQKLSEAVERMAEKSEATAREVYALLERVKVVIDRIDVRKP